MAIILFLSSCCKKDVEQERISILNFADTCEYPNYESKVPDYYNLFARKLGWTGADGAYSFEIPGLGYVWLFGDTWAGLICNGRRQDGSYLAAHNSIGLQSLKQANTANLKFYFGGDPTNPKSFFEQDNYIMWPQHGVFVNGKAYIFFSRVGSTSEGIGFKHLGNDIAVIHNPLSDPSEWSYSWQSALHGWSDGITDISYGTAILQEGDSLYIYGSKTDHNIGSRFMILSRTHVNDILKPTNWQFYTGSTWLNNADSAAHLLEGVATEYSVSYVSNLNKYVLITSPMGLSKEIVLYKSDSPWGPWQDPVVVYECPEMDWDNEVFCYAAKGHFELSENDKLLITYCTNSFDFSKTVEDARLGYPRFVEADLK
ncbi:MAG: DUF4185 domain-containing protein [Flavobacteriales bacterium]|nr:DUF4185 domain-containing protein [Flavobacteriales bacterium]